MYLDQFGNCRFYFIKTVPKGLMGGGDLMLVPGRDECICLCFKFKTCRIFPSGIFWCGCSRSCSSCDRAKKKSKLNEDCNCMKLQRGCESCS